MKTGIQVSSLRPLLKTAEQVKEAFCKIKAMGCHTVQLQWIDPTVNVDVIAEALQKANLQSVSVQDFYETICENPEYYIDLNQKTGGTWMCISRIPDRLKSEQGLQVFVDELREFQRMLDRYGQKLCFHPVTADYKAVEDLDAVEWILDQMPELAVALDLYHLYYSGYDMPSWIRKYKGRICMVHYKDAVGEQLVPAGQGEVRWDGVTEACLEAGVSYAFAEQERWNRDPYVCLKEAMDWLEKDIARVQGL